MHRTNLVSFFRSEAETLFILVRDVPSFEEKYAKEVLAFVHDLGFTGPEKEPQRIIQEGCLPFDPTTLAARKVGDSRDDGFFCLSLAMRGVRLCAFRVISREVYEFMRSRIFQ